MARLNKILLFSFLLTFLFFVETVSAAETKKQIIIDTDEDGLSDEIEIKLGTDPNNADTDGDSYVDGKEVANGYNPLAGERNRYGKRHVEVNLSDQTLRYFFNDVEVGKAPISSGVRGKDTPIGQFKITRKVPVVHYKGPGYDLPNTKWNLEFKRSYYLHGAYWHKQFGIRPMSHGCVNIAYKDAEKIYKFLQVGDGVKIYGKTPAHALAKK
jgi:lipoprotein-anchoring transpeptidase ErfK/SrfK